MGQLFYVPEVKSNTTMSANDAPEFCDWGQPCGSFYVIDGTKHAVRVPNTSGGDAACTAITAACVVDIPYNPTCVLTYGGYEAAGEAYWHKDYLLSGRGPTNDGSCF